MLEIEPLDITPQLPAPEQLERELIQRGVTAPVAGELVRDHAEDKVRAQIERLDWLIEKKPEKIADPAAYLVEAIKNDYAAPKGFISKAERQRRQEAKQAKEREAAEERRRKQEEEARERAMRKAINAHWASLTPEQQAELDAASIAQADPDTLAMEKGPMKDTFQRIRRDQYIRQLLEAAADLRQRLTFRFHNAPRRRPGGLSAARLDARSPQTATSLRARLQSLTRDAHRRPPLPAPEYRGRSCRIADRFAEGIEIGFFARIVPMRPWGDDPAKCFAAVGRFAPVFVI